MKRNFRWMLPAAFAALAGCAEMPAPKAPEPPPAPPPATQDARITQAIAQHRRLADSAKRSGDLAAAATQWQILALLAPDDDGYKRELATTRTAIAGQIREQLQIGATAVAAGDFDRASQAMLRVLALDPNQPEAANRWRFTRIQADRAAKVRIEDTVAIRGAMRAQAAAGDVGDGFDVEQALEMYRAGDSIGGMRDLKAYVDANPGNRAARQRIGAAVADRARELEGQGSREQAVTLYEQATTLRGDGSGPWVTRVPPLKRDLSQEYLDKGSRAYRTNVAQAITFFETSLRYDPANVQAAVKLKDAKAVKEKLDRIDKDAGKK